MTRRDERGGATVLVLVFVTVLVCLAVAGVVAGGVLVGQRRAAAAADLTALAAAESLGPRGGTALGGATACEQAVRVGEANGARLTDCLVEGREVSVELTVEVPTLFGSTWSIPGRARAGPVGGAVGGAARGGSVSGSAGPGP